MAKNTVRTAIGNNIVTLRKKLNLKQSEVAALIDVSRDSYAKYETSIVPPVDKLIALAKIFGVTIDDLTGVVNQYQPSKPQPAVVFRARSPYLTGIEANNPDNLLDLNETEARLLLKFRELSEEKQSAFLQLLGDD